MNSAVDLRLLVTFAAVVRSGSMTTAAAELDYVPSAVSQQIAALERLLGGVELFTRKQGRRTTVTAAGRALAEAADELFGATAVFQDRVTAVSCGRCIDIRVGAYGTALSHLLPEVLRPVSQGQRGCSIRVLEVETVQGLPMLERGELDVLIASRYLREDPPWPSGKLVITPLGSEPLLLVCARGSATPPSFDDCKQRDWVAGAPKDVDRKQLGRWASGVGFEPRVRYESADYHTAIELIAADMAVGLVPVSLLCAHHKSAVEPVPLPRTVVVPTRDVLAVTRARFQMPVVDELLAAMAGVVGGDAFR